MYLIHYYLVFENLRTIFQKKIYPEGKILKLKKEEKIDMFYAILLLKKEFNGSTYLTWQDILCSKELLCEEIVIFPLQVCLSTSISFKLNCAVNCILRCMKKYILLYYIRDIAYQITYYLSGIQILKGENMNINHDFCFTIYVNKINYEATNIFWMRSICMFQFLHILVHVQELFFNFFI